MIWLGVELLEEVPTGEKDKLGNVITKMESLGHVDGRKAIFTNTETDIYDQEFLQSHIKIVIRPKNDIDCGSATHVRFNGVVYAIKETNDDNPRWWCYLLKKSLK